MGALNKWAASSMAVTGQQHHSPGRVRVSSLGRGDPSRPRRPWGTKRL